MSKRTITLTDRPPVSIDEDSWPVIAEARDEEYDGQVRCQANRISTWAVRVRQHADGRAIVYATYGHNTNWQGARGYSARRGALLPVGGDIIAAIREVCAAIADAECSKDDAARWPTLVADCIADLPTEELA